MLFSKVNFSPDLINENVQKTSAFLLRTPSMLLLLFQLMNIVGHCRFIQNETILIGVYNEYKHVSVQFLCI